MGDGTADGASEGEARIKRHARHWSSGRYGADGRDGLNLWTGARHLEFRQGFVVRVIGKMLRGREGQALGEMQEKECIKMPQKDAVEKGFLANERERNE